MIYILPIMGLLSVAGFWACLHFVLMSEPYGSWLPGHREHTAKTFVLSARNRLRLYAKSLRKTKKQEINQQEIKQGDEVSSPLFLDLEGKQRPILLVFWFPSTMRGSFPSVRPSALT